MSSGFSGRSRQEQKIERGERIVFMFLSHECIQITRKRIKEERTLLERWVH